MIINSEPVFGSTHQLYLTEAHHIPKCHVIATRIPIRGRWQDRILTAPIGIMDDDDDEESENLLDKPDEEEEEETVEEWTD